MSRSWKKRPFSGITTATSEKKDKQLANRHTRRVNKYLLSFTHDPDKLLLKRELSNVWSMAKDGKVRFDPATHPKLLRK